MENTFSYLEKGSMQYTSFIKKMVDFVNKEQLLKPDLWKKFVQVFIDKEDHTDIHWWRCEFWGKMMRGACLCYQYENNPELYKVLEDTTRDLLKTQDELGRICSYPVENEFTQWDVWGRKYVITSLLHFYEICKDNQLKEDIVNAVKKHADYIMLKIGNKEGQINITDTSEWWSGINSSSICEPFVNLYRVTKENKYLEYAKYIIDNGGIKEANLLDLVEEGKLKPYQFPAPKAYETLSFFEGVLDYAEVTNDKRLYNLAIKFYEDVYETDISITGNAGSNEEIFSNASINQTFKPEKFMQETCVTVTWMRVLSKLHLLTGEAKYHNRMTHSAINAFYGSINYNHQSARDWFAKTLLPALPFDSYSPLHCDRRGISTGGLQYLKDGSIYGCCACIASAGVGLMCNNSVLKNDKYLIINDYYEGTVKTNDFELDFSGEYLKTGISKIQLKSNSNKLLKIRVPEWAKNPTITINDKEYIAKAGDYFVSDLSLKEIKDIFVSYNPEIVKHEINGFICYTFGEVVLAVDEENNPDIVLEDLSDSKISDFKQIKTDDLLSFSAQFDGILIKFKDYASSGKRWDIPKNRLTVFVNK